MFQQNFIYQSSNSVDSDLCLKFINETIKDVPSGLSTLSEFIDLKKVQEFADYLKYNFKTVVFLGTGGSSLGGKVLCSLSPEWRCGTAKTKILFLEDIHPTTFEESFRTLDPQTTAIVTISKSGSTAETMAQLLVFLDRWSVNGEEFLKNHFFAITQPGDSTLRKVALHHNFRVVYCSPNVGGRYSVFSMVGLLPAAILGLDIYAFRKGGLEIVRNMKDSIVDSIKFKLSNLNLPMTILFSYSQRLDYFLLWYRQLWSESIGKKGIGSTPVIATGTVDQHSQLQLYLAGPKDKSFTFFYLNDEKLTEIKIPDTTNITRDLKYLSNSTMEMLLHAEYLATVETISKDKRPVSTFTIEKFNEKTIGGLLAYSIVETVVCAKIKEVNPFDQPAVEQGKILAKEYLLNTNH